MYECQTCGQIVAGLNAARKHAKQGHKTQREAFQAGELHTLTRKEMKRYPYTAEDGNVHWACCDSTIGPTCEHLTTRKETNA